MLNGPQCLGSYSYSDMMSLLLRSETSRQQLHTRFLRSEDSPYSCKGQSSSASKSTNHPANFPHASHFIVTRPEPITMQSLRRSLLARRPAAASFPSRRTPAPAPRHFQTSSRCLARKDAQGKDDINTESNEYSKSGSDDKSSAVEEAAFSPDKTSPEEQQAHAEGEANEQGVSLTFTYTQQGLCVGGDVFANHGNSR
ncbi:hypothetical protein BAUCODRAFT_571740 [Baudoinia panamericana UAMH 10762]|uniref:Uncharacterized protein n=1 Tax=Baudoinia panamericana (strain UAMH 10762) TaxID=717646 RepID=M2MRW3_BAUPA|nr:uncharacterized protein BAUCODRAFT_571740 [Baudoinia panamericana UAMH 10762]EMC99571.1 hypothetical protein BAUCODRAFT_571740 [Baudoinia panamericana UAMH 10762]